MEDKNSGGFADVKIEPVGIAAPPKVPLKRQVRPFNAAFGSTGFCTNGLNVQFMHRTAKPQISRKEAALNDWLRHQRKPAPYT